MRYWKRVDGQGNTLTVESCSNDAVVAGAREITKVEYDRFIADLPPPPAPTDWPALWAAATTADMKFALIAQRFGWE